MGSGEEENGDYEEKGFELTLSKITKPNIKTKVRRRCKKDKAKLEMVAKVASQTKIIIGKGCTLPQGK